MRQVPAHSIAAVLLLAFMGVLAGGAALRQSATIDEVAHIGAGVSALQQLDLRMNPEHPPLPKMLSALPLVLRGTRADYSSPQWTASSSTFNALLGEWFFGDWLLNKWNDPVTTLAWARLPMLLLTLLLGWAVYVCGRQLGGGWGGLLSLSVYASLPAFLAFGPLVHTDLAITVSSLLTMWSFAGLYRDPTRKQVWIFAACLAGALLSKFTALLLFPVFLAFALSARWRPLPGQPADSAEARAWRKARWRATLRGVWRAWAMVYVFYFVFSVRQTSDVLGLIPGGAALDPVRRLLTPPWLYLLGVLLVLLMGSRSCFILGHIYAHGVWFYFPVVFLLKSPLSFLGLLVLALVVWLITKRKANGTTSGLVPAHVAPHWRALWVTLMVMVSACLLSRVSLGIRHFSVPLIIMILLLAPLPALLERLRNSIPWTARALQALTVVLAVSCLFAAVWAYPYYTPYLGLLSLGRPACALVNASNVDWNQSLPEVRKFAERQGLTDLPVDFRGFTDPAVTVPGARLWNCQTPQEADRGRLVVVSASNILEGHNCAWLLSYPHESLAGGAMYAFRLPIDIPPAGSLGGPPPPSEIRQLWGTPSNLDLRVRFHELSSQPDRIPAAFEKFWLYLKERRAKARSPSDSRPN
jgi:hypothetical protein